MKYKMRTVSALTGFSPALLRAWEHRYRLFEPERTASGYRLYSEEDLAVLRQIQQLLNQGRSIGEIALVGREGLLAQAAAVPRPDSNPNRGVEQWRQAIADGATEMDRLKIESALDHAFAVMSPEQALSEVVEPAAKHIGDRWASGDCSVAGEHLASEIFCGRLRMLLDAGQSYRAGSPKALCACFPEEAHALGILIVACVLNRRGFQASCLGAALPFEDLERACDLLSPRIVCLSVTREAVFESRRPELAEFVRRRGGTVNFWIGGQGVPERDHLVEEAGARLWPRGRPAREVPLAA